MCDELNNSENKNDELFDILLGVQSACKTAVEMLNDLLCFDKLESGTMELHKLDVEVVPFIADCANMFSSQAREGDITIINLTEQLPSSPINSNNNNNQSREQREEHNRLNRQDTNGLLRSSDTVHIDKFKMDQVLRNLISNALKFTPRGGCVTICASFIPNKEHSGDSSDAATIAGDALSGSRAEHSGTSRVPNFFLQLFGMFFFRKEYKMKNTKIHATIDDQNAMDDIEMATIPAARLHDTFDANPSTSNPCDNTGGPWNESSIANMSTKSTRNSGEITRGKSCRKLLKYLSHDTIPIERTGPTDEIAEIHGKLRVTVSDTGVGMAKSNLDRLFKEIVQFNPEVLQAGGGSGLGLWITSSIVKMHGGCISVHSDGVGKGSSFTVEIDMHRKSALPFASNSSRSLPFDIPTLTPSQGPETNRAPGDDNDHDIRSVTLGEYHIHSDRTNSSQPLSSNEFKTDEDTDKGSGIGSVRFNREINRSQSYSPKNSYHKRFNLPNRSKSFPQPQMEIDISKKPPSPGVCDILVVDDSSLNRRLLCRLLNTSGHICDEASDGLIAVQKVKDRLADTSNLNREYLVILMDFVMPNMDGPAATQSIRNLGYYGPIFGVTGNVLDSDVNYFVGCGVNAVLTKPFDYTKFKELMKERHRDTMFNHNDVCTL